MNGCLWGECAPRPGKTLGAWIPGALNGAVWKQGLCGCNRLKSRSPWTRWALIPPPCPYKGGLWTRTQESQDTGKPGGGGDGNAGAGASPEHIPPGLQEDLTLPTPGAWTCS